MISKIKSRLGIGKMLPTEKPGATASILASTTGSQSSCLDAPQAIPKPVASGSSVKPGQKADVPPSTPPGARKEKTEIRPASPTTANSVGADQSDDNEVVNRERVGRVSNRLSKRAEIMRNQDSSAARSLLSNSLRTLESIASTGSQADYFNPQQSITILDWDDTLCPSHWIRINRPKLQYFQPCPDDPRFKTPLDALSEQVIKVLRASCAVSKTIVLTNAQVGWVEISCRNFMPKVWPVLKELNVDIVYARQSVEQDVMTSRELDYNYNANAPQLWKERAMKDNISQFYSQYLHQSWKNIISIGDQACEHNACRIVALARPSTKKSCRTKTVKLIEEPSIENLIAENQVILQWLRGLVHYDGELNIDLSHDDDVLLDLHDMLARK